MKYAILSVGPAMWIAVLMAREPLGDIPAGDWWGHAMTGWLLTAFWVALAIKAVRDE